MTVTKRTVRFGPDDSFSGVLVHLARAKAPLPGIVVIQEAWGLDEHVEDIAERFARAGYVAFAPDVYARNGVRPAELEKDRAKEMKEFFDELPPAKALDPDAREAILQTKPSDVAERIRSTARVMFAQLAKGEVNLPPIVAAARYLRTDCELSRGQKIASIGFCAGGMLSARLAAEDPELAAAIVFYGSGPPDDIAKRIQCPILGCYGSLDARINGSIPGFEAALKEAGTLYEKHMYEGAGHAFFNDTRSSYHAEASRLAYARALSFLVEHLD